MESCVLRPIRTVRAALAAPFDSLGTMLSSHRAVTRVVLAALSFTFIIAFSQQATVTQAGPEAGSRSFRGPCSRRTSASASPPTSAVTIAFDAAMNPGSVEDALQVLPAQPVELSWSENLDQLTVAPDRTVAHRRDVPRRDRRHCAAYRRASAPPATRYSFTTQTAPTVTDFQVRLAEALPQGGLDASAKAMAADVLDADAVSRKGDRRGSTDHHREGRQRHQRDHRELLASRWTRADVEGQLRDHARGAR